jgi:hypothetical protein
MIRTIKALFIRLWVWLTPQAAKNAIQADFMRQMAGYKPSFGQISQPLVRRFDYGDIGRKIFQVEPLPAAAQVIYDPDPVNNEQL